MTGRSCYEIHVLGIVYVKDVLRQDGINGFNFAVSQSIFLYQNKI